MDAGLAQEQIKQQLATQMIQQMAVGGAHIAKAFVNYWNEVGNVEFDAKSHTNQYATLYAVLKTVKPIAKKWGLAFPQMLGETIDGRMELITIVVHESGQQWRFKSSLPLADAGWNKKANKPNPIGPQQAASASSYLKRYTIVALSGICGVDDDDDGNGAYVEEEEDSGLSAADIAKVLADIEAFAPKKREPIDTTLERMKTELEESVRATGDESVVTAYTEKRKVLRKTAKVEK